MCDEASRPEHMVRSSLVAYKVQQREKILVHYFEKSSNSVVVADSRLNNLVVSSISCLRPLMAFSNKAWPFSFSLAFVRLKY